MGNKTSLKSQRVLTVAGTYWACHYRRYSPPDAQVPLLRLCGYWMAEAGIKAGMKVRISIAGDGITIRPA
jgi:hypothetical protein